MFITLTKPDGTPIWINAAFVVTIEPRKGGGAIVVPIGDGLDYEVRESPEAVLKALADGPSAAIVPVPVSDALAPTPADVSPEPEPASVAEGEKPARRSSRAKSKALEPPAKSASAAEKPAARRKAPSRPALTELDDEGEARLRRMAPGSVKKLQNTLVKQFGVVDAEKVVKSLEERGMLEVSGSRVVWRQTAAEEQTAAEAQPADKK